MNVKKIVSFGNALAIGALVSGSCLFGGDAPAPAPAPAPAAPVPAPLAPAPAPAPPVRAPRQHMAPPPAAETPQDIKDMTNASYLLDLAQVHLRYNALDRAEEMLKKALAGVKTPDEKARVNYQLGALFQQRRDWKSAAASYEEALTSVTNPAQKGQYAVALSDAYTQAGEIDKAEKVLTEIASADGPPRPEDAWVKNMAWQRLLSVWQRQEGKLEKVSAELEAQLAKDPQNMVALEHLSEIYSGARRDAKKAIVVLEKLSEKKPADNSLQTRLASMYQEDKQFDKAIAIHQKLMASDPKGVGQFSSLQVAQILLQSGKKDEALAWVKEHLAKDASTPGSVSMLEMFYEQAGMLEEAEDALSKMAAQAQSGPQKADYLLRLADLARRRKDYVKAEKEIRGVISTFKDEKNTLARANSALVRLFEEQGKMGELKLDK